LVTHPTFPNLWLTVNPFQTASKNIHVIPDKIGLISVILDGQQRLTSLYLLIEGDIPPYYVEADIVNDPRDLYFNLETGDLQYYQATRMRDTPLWVRMVDCFHQKINVFEIAREKSQDDDNQAFQLAELYNENLNQLRHIHDMDLPVQTVPSHARIDEAINIFDRVNSQGTKLTDAELALTHVTGKWPQARREMKAKIDDLAATNFSFSPSPLTFMTRALTCVVTKRALLPSIHGSAQDELMAGWKQLVRILDYLVTVLPHAAFIHSTEDLNTTNAFVPLIVYLSLNNNRFPDQASMMQAIHWLYVAHTWARYTAQTDQRLEHDVSLVMRDAQPWPALCEQIIDQRGRIDLKPSDLEGRGIQHPLFRMAYILAKAHGAVDWSNGAPLGTTHGEAYRIHSHHIFPQSLLYKYDYDPDNHLHIKIVNEIANRAVLTADTNLDLSNTPPEEYLPEVEQSYPGALSAQFIPMDPNLWRLERFPDFLEARRTLISKKFNEFVGALIAEPVTVYEQRVTDLIPRGESATLEFKSTLQWDMIQGQMSESLRLSVLKTIAAFLNSNGGTLVIGVEDTGAIVGLAHDLQTFNNPSLDTFQQTLMNLAYELLGPQFAPFIRVRFEEANGCTVCVVDVERSPEPAFTQTRRGVEFFIRMGNTTRSLDLQETTDYIQMNWE